MALHFCAWLRYKSQARLVDVPLIGTRNDQTMAYNSDDASLSSSIRCSSSDGLSKVCFEHDARCFLQRQSIWEWDLSFRLLLWVSLYQSSYQFRDPLIWAWTVWNPSILWKHELSQKAFLRRNKQWREQEWPQSL